MDKIKIRSATVDDAKDLLEIYRFYVEKTAITYEISVPSLEEFSGRISGTLKKFPYIVVEREGELIAYAYASSFKSREAYRFSVETSVYVKKDFRRRGVGRILLDELESRLSSMGILNVYACIAEPDVEDEYLTFGSINFHKKMGYRLVGEFKKCAKKFDRWYNMVWMEKFIGEHR